MATLTPVFVDTSVLVAGLIDLGPEGEAPQRILTGIAEGRIARPLTAWHCCLEFYSVSTRLPPGLRLNPRDALRLLEEEVFMRFRILELPCRRWKGFLRTAAQAGVAGGRVYDAHIAEIARGSAAKAIVTDNPRHFAPLLAHLPVLSSADFVTDQGLRSARIP